MLRPTPTPTRRGDGPAPGPEVPPPPHTPWWLWVLLVVTAATLVGVAVYAGMLLRDVDAGPDLAEQEPLEPVDEPPADDPPDQPAETFAPDETPPPPLDGLTSLDPTQVVTTHDAYVGWLFEHPQQAVAGGLNDNVHHPDCPCYEHASVLLAHYAEEGLWWADGGDLRAVEVELVDVPGAPSDDPADTGAMVVRVVYERTETSRLIDSTGDVHDSVPPRRWAEELVFVRGTADDPGLGEPWLLRNFEDLGDVARDSDA